MPLPRKLQALALAVVFPVAALTLLPGMTSPGEEQPSGQPAKGEQPKVKDKDKEDWRETLKKEEKAHPRLFKALWELHETKEYLEKAPHDFGGHKAAAIKSVDSAIKELHEALKFDAQHEEKHEKDKEEKPAGKK